MEMNFTLSFNFTWQSLLYSIGVALVYGVLGFFSNNPKETFDPALFLKTVIISVAVGLGITFTGGDPTKDYANMLVFISANTVFTSMVDDFVNKVLHLTPSSSASTVPVTTPATTNVIVSPSVNPSVPVGPQSFQTKGWQ